MKGVGIMKGERNVKKVRRVKGKSLLAYIDIETSVSGGKLSEEHELKFRLFVRRGEFNQLLTLAGASVAIVSGDFGRKDAKNAEVMGERKCFKSIGEFLEVVGEREKVSAEDKEMLKLLKAAMKDPALKAKVLAAMGQGE